jgi:hypothetical protein
MDEELDRAGIIRLWNLSNLPSKMRKRPELTQSENSIWPWRFGPERMKRQFQHIWGWIILSIQRAAWNSRMNKRSGF